LYCIIYFAKLFVKVIVGIYGIFEEASFKEETVIGKGYVTWYLVTGNF